jgi:hypothetical protein
MAATLLVLASAGEARAQRPGGPGRAGAGRGGQGPGRPAPGPQPSGGAAGWSGWKAQPNGNAARGAGALGVGAGVYNSETADARSTNADTAMRTNQYVYDRQQERNTRYYGNLAADKQQNVENAATVANRIRSNPDAHDIESGDAENLALDDLTDPKVYQQALQVAGATRMPSELVRDIPFANAAEAISISFEDLLQRGAPDALRDPAFAADAKALKAIGAKARQEAEAHGGKISDATLESARSGLVALQGKVKRAYPQGTPGLREADNYLRALINLTKMLEGTDMAAQLAELNTVEEVSLAHLIAFTQSFNLRFGAARTSRQKAVYQQLYPMLDAVRDRVNPQGTNPTAPPPSGDAAGAAAAQAYYAQFGAVAGAAASPDQAPAPAGGPSPGRGPGSLKGAAGGGLRRPGAGTAPTAPPPGP